MTYDIYTNTEKTVSVHESENDNRLYMTVSKDKIFVSVDEEYTITDPETKEVVKKTKTATFILRARNKETKEQLATILEALRL